eukprot:31135-Pelagococcus_subviridis.AAC.20
MMRLIQVDRLDVRGRERGAAPRALPRPVIDPRLYALLTEHVVAPRDDDALEAVVTHAASHHALVRVHLFLHLVVAAANLRELLVPLLQPRDLFLALLHPALRRGDRLRVRVGAVRQPVDAFPRRLRRRALLARALLNLHQRVRLLLHALREGLGLLYRARELRLALRGGGLDPGRAIRGGDGGAALVRHRRLEPGFFLPQLPRERLRLDLLRHRLLLRAVSLRESGHQTRVLRLRFLVRGADRFHLRHERLALRGFLLERVLGVFRLRLRRRRRPPRLRELIRERLGGAVFGCLAPARCLERFLRVRRLRPRRRRLARRLRRGFFRVVDVLPHRPRLRRLRTQLRVLLLQLFQQRRPLLVELLPRRALGRLRQLERDVVALARNRVQPFFDVDDALLRQLRASVLALRLARRERRVPELRAQALPLALQGSDRVLEPLRVLRRGRELLPKRLVRLRRGHARVVLGGVAQLVRLALQLRVDVHLLVELLPRVVDPAFELRDEAFQPQDLDGVRAAAAAAAAAVRGLLRAVEHRRPRRDRNRAPDRLPPRLHRRGRHPGRPGHGPTTRGVRRRRRYRRRARRRARALRRRHRRKPFDLPRAAPRARERPSQELHLRGDVLELIPELFVPNALLRRDLSESLEFRDRGAVVRLERREPPPRRREDVVGVSPRVGVGGVERVEDGRQRRLHRGRAELERGDSLLRVRVEAALRARGAVLVRVGRVAFVSLCFFGVVVVVPRALPPDARLGRLQQPSKERVLHVRVRDVVRRRRGCDARARGERADVILKRVPLRRDDVDALLVRRLFPAQRRRLRLRGRDLLPVHLELYVAKRGMGWGAGGQRGGGRGAEARDRSIDRSFDRAGRARSSDSAREK